MRLINSLDRWQVTLSTGAVVEVWADAYSEEDAGYVFVVLADVDPEEQARLFLQGRTPSDPRRVVVAVAVFPTDQVTKVRSA